MSLTERKLPWWLRSVNCCKQRQGWARLAPAAVELEPDVLQEIDSAVSTMTIEGDRYPADLKKMTGR
jgi:hypothetical protein